ncbi:MAG: IS21 family transposase [Clostridia bacterium]|nr:IS21 family transposase [Clostridia bacterium]
MISLKQKQIIILMHYREGKSQREIQKITGVDRKTIRKYIKNYEKQREGLELKGTLVESGELIESIVEAPKYTVGVRPKRKLTEKIERKIKDYLDENEEKRKKGRHKQLKKPMDIFEALEAEDFDISYSTVLRVVRTIEQKSKEAFIKEVYALGDICEFDWGEVKITIGGRPRVLQMAVFTSAYGNYRYAYLFTKQKTECYQEAHARFFDHIGGIYQTMVYDNMKVAVKSFVGTEKEPTERLLQLSLYYGFGFRFCNIRRGNEKGHVERSVEVVRRKAFAFKDEFETLEEANQYLLEVCKKRNEKPRSEQQGQSASELLECEREYLLPRVPMFDAARIVYPRVDKYSTIVVDQNHYSAPDHLVGQKIMAKVYSDRVECFHQESKIAQHPRLTGCHEWSLKLEHYLNTLKKKPGALANSVALQQATEKIKNIYENYYTKKEKHFIELMQFIRDEAPLEKVEEIIKELVKIHPSHVSTDKIKVLYAKNQEIVSSPITMSLEAQEIVNHARQHLKEYDNLFQTYTVTSKEAS